MSVQNYRRESLKLYRDIVRASKMFTWRDQQGNPWSEVLKKNARKEFEAARFERDPVIITRLLVVGRDSYNQVIEKFGAAAKKVQDNIDKTRTS